jgi:protein-S-isoprenylcysteine O-methyltransferase Ste14
MAIGWLFISRHVEPSIFDLFFAIFLHHLGVVTMIAADGQRHFELKHKKGLITGGVYKYTRNPNYLADHWFAWLVIAVQSFVMFIPRMYMKDRTISRHPGWAEYKAQSGLLIPWAVINGRGLK